MRNNNKAIRAHKRHVRLFKFLHFAVSPFFKRKFNYTYDDLSTIEGPFLLLSNHNMELDPAFVGMAVKNQIYFVASEHVTRNKFIGWLLDFVFAPILHYKGKAGVNTISNMLHTLKAGHNVAIFPEGNRSFSGKTLDFLPTIGKLARKSGAKLVTFKMEGGYFSQPRWSFTLRKGQLTGKLIHIYELDELKSMTDDEVNDAIIKDLYEDAYKTQARERIAFEGKRLAYGLESTLFMCPECQKIGTLSSDNKFLKCCCGSRAEYNVYGDLARENAPSLTVTGIDEQQKEALKERIIELKNSGAVDTVLFEDEITLMEIQNHKIINKRTGCFKAYCDHATFTGTDVSAAINIEPIALQGVAIRSRNTIVTHTLDNRQFELTGTSEVFNALKYLYLYDFLKG